MKKEDLKEAIKDQSETFYLDAEKPYWEDDNDYLKNNTVAKKEDKNETAG